MSRKLLLGTGLLLAFASMASVAHGTDYPVPSYAYPDITSAIAAASAADRVIVTSAGTYAYFTLNKAVEVTNTSGGMVTVDGTGSSYAAQVTASGGKITNLSLTGGSSGILSMTNGTVSGCIINDGTTPYSGSAVYMSYHSRLENCTLNLTSTSSARAIRMTNSAGSRV